MTYLQFLKRNARFRNLHQRPYFSSALKLRFKDAQEMRAFLGTNAAREFNRFSFQCKSSKNWRAADWALLQRLTQAQAIELDLTGFDLGWGEGFLPAQTQLPHLPALTYLNLF